MASYVLVIFKLLDRVQNHMRKVFFLKCAISVDKTVVNKVKIILLLAYINLVLLGSTPANQNKFCFFFLRSLKETSIPKFMDVLNLLFILDASTCSVCPMYCWKTVIPLPSQCFGQTGGRVISGKLGACPNGYNTLTKQNAEDGGNQNELSKTAKIKSRRNEEIHPEVLFSPKCTHLTKWRNFSVRVVVAFTVKQTRQRNILSTFAHATMTLNFTFNSTRNLNSLKLSSPIYVGS